VDAGKVTAFFDSGDQTKSPHAIFMDATVKATRAQSDSIGNWDIGFIQVISEPVNTYHFAGLDDTDGSLIMDLSDDTYVSPSHCLYIEGVLIPASDLVNGFSISRCGHEGDIEYFHIELDTHEVVYAEGAAVETLLGEGMTSFATIKARNGGRSELEAFLRRLAQPVIDIPRPYSNRL
jgi:hypothetical protein